MRKIAYIFVWIFCASIPMQELAASTLVEVSGTLSRLLGAAAMIAGISALIYDGKLRRFLPVHGFMVLFLAWGAFTFLWSADQTLTYGRLITNVQLLAMVVLFAQFASQEDESTGLVVAYVFGSLLSLFELGRRYVTGASIVATLFNERYSAFDNNPNDYALALALAIPMGWYLASRRLSIWTTLLGYSYTALGFVGVLLTGSRGGFLAAIAGALIIPVSMISLGRRERIAGIVVAVIGLMVAVEVTPEAVWTRLSTIEELGDEVPSAELDGVNIRTVVWSAGMAEFMTNPQVATVGIGAGAYQAGVVSVYGDRLVAHNVFVSILIEQGLIGFVLFVVVLVMLAGTLRYLPPAERLLWIFVFFTWGIGVSFVTWEQTKNTWFIIGVLAARGVSARYVSARKPGFLASLMSRTKMGYRLRREFY